MKRAVIYYSPGTYAVYVESESGCTKELIDSFPRKAKAVALAKSLNKKFNSEALTVAIGKIKEVS